MQQGALCKSGVGVEVFSVTQAFFPEWSGKQWMCLLPGFSGVGHENEVAESQDVVMGLLGCAGVC